MAAGKITGINGANNRYLVSGGWFGTSGRNA